ncbi:MAG TPA: heparinase II/III family protein [Gemmatimonadaceae bacterium]
MSLLLSADQLLARRRVANGSLDRLAIGLQRELAPLLACYPDVPREKALLSRAGGRCDRDGALLTYDPFDPRHRCPVCGRELTGDVHDHFRLYWHQLWLAERAVHAALIGVLRDDGNSRTLAAHLLDQYADRYLAYPNRDNVLGPSRPFFSTYLESIWLLQVMIALDLLESGAPSGNVRALGARVRDRVIAPSAELIASFDEGMSNRQVWNDAALASAGVMLGRSAMVDSAVRGSSGLEQLLTHGLLEDGSWYEGENYHFFAHRGLWYGITIAEQNGHALPPALASRFREGFASPFRTLLPDLTYPSRRDSQYAVSVRQPRFAESCELGLARADDDRLVGMLARLYDPTVPRAETGRRSTSADVERNLPATGLSRADLSWRGVLFARETLPAVEPRPFESELLAAQGFGVLRRDDGALYAALDYGQSGGGHGHPDRLNVIFSDGNARWFDDPGTGSYVDPSLHWYRSTLAHTAPLVDGRSQRAVDGRLLEFATTGDERQISAEAELLPGLTVRRRLALVEDCLLDVLEWTSDDQREIALPLHGVDLVGPDDAPLARYPAPLDGGDGVEDGFDFLQRTARIESAGDAVHVRALGERGELRGWVRAEPSAEWWSAVAPDVPSRTGMVPMLLARMRAPRGRLVGVWSSRGSVADVAFESTAVVVHWRDGHRTRQPIAIPHSAPIQSSTATRPIPSPRSSAPSYALPAAFSLGEPNYRRSEESWRDAGSPRAEVSVAMAAPRELTVDVTVHPSSRRFVSIDAENPLDNEPAAINGDGVQLYVAIGDQRAGWLLVPEPRSSNVAVRPIDGWRGDVELQATWRPTDAGYALAVRLRLPGGVRELGLDVLVNEIAPNRERRRGQLVLSGAAGEFVYLRGDRHDPERLLHFVLPDV